VCKTLDPHTATTLEVVSSHAERVRLPDCSTSMTSGSVSDAWRMALIREAMCQNLDVCPTHSSELWELTCLLAPDLLVLLLESASPTLNSPPTMSLYGL